MSCKSHWEENVSLGRMETSDDRDLYWDLGRMKSVTRLKARATMCATMSRKIYIVTVWNLDREFLHLFGRLLSIIGFS